MDEAQPATLEFSVVPTDSIAPEVRARVLALFHASYRGADDSYLEQSFAKLRYLAIATTADGAVAGFARGDMRIPDLPGLPRQPLALAGICCVNTRFRCCGLFREPEAMLGVRLLQVRGKQWKVYTTDPQLFGMAVESETGLEILFWSFAQPDKIKPKDVAMRLGEQIGKRY